MWRFRKIFNFGAFRTSVSKGGVGYSYGFFGLRFGVSPNGAKYISFGIPGTGLYFIKYLNSPNHFPQNMQQTKNIQNSNNTQKRPNIVTSKPSKIEWWKQKDLNKF